MRAGPFTVDWVREAIRAHAPRLCVPSEQELVQIATLLNTINGAYHNRAGKTLAIGVRYAIWVLGHFFEARKKACQEPGVDPHIIEREIRLRDLFDSFVKAMAAHPCALDMDVGHWVRPYESWRDVDTWIAHAFKMALETCNHEKIGLTSGGPIARLTNAAIEAITGRAPGVRNVGQHLKQPYQKQGRTR